MSTVYKQYNRKWDAMNIEMVDEIRKQLFDYVMNSELSEIEISKRIGIGPTTLSRFLKGAEIRRRTLVRIVRFIDKNN